MTQIARFQRQTRYLTLLLIGALLLGALPSHPVLAALVTQRLDDSLADFTGGTFQRTALSSITVSDGDEVGGVQLSRSGELKPWISLANVLPARLTDAGAVTLGRRIYVIGGSSGGEQANVNTVYWAEINPDSGTPFDPSNPENNQPWRSLDPLPAVAANDSCPSPVAAVSGAAVASVPTGGNGGYIYVMGGSVFPSGCGIAASSYAVHIGTVNSETGRITWSSGPKLPGEPDPFGGEEFRAGYRFARAVTINAGARTFLYFIGGQTRYPGIGGSAFAAGSRRVFRAEVNRGTGALSNWVEDAPLPIPGDLGPNAGLWNATAVGGYFDGGGQGGYAIYVTGGQQSFDGNDTQRFNTVVYRAIVNPTTGALTWTAQAGPPSRPDAIIPESRTGMSAVELNGKLYMIGGRQPSGTGTLRSSVLTTYVEDDLSLPTFGTETERIYFIESPGVLDPRPRADHASVIIPATPRPNEPGAAWVYVIGGADANGATDNIFYGRIGGADESDANRLAPNGWYYSKPFAIQIQNTDVDVQEIRWTTAITRTGPSDTTDVQVSYRVARTTGSCDGPTVFTTNPDLSQWRILDGDPTNETIQSRTGQNSVVFADENKPPSASCLQYRARLVTTNLQSSPALLNVSVLKFVPGSPDLKMQEPISEIRNEAGQLKALRIKITNQNDFESPTQPADYEKPGRGGSFFVDLCISAPNGTLTPPPSKEGKSPDCSSAYINVSKTAMPAGAVLDLPTNNRQWIDSRTNQQIPNVLAFFPQPGVYEVLVAIDGENLVNEGDKGAATNNVSAVLRVTITEDGIDPNEPIDPITGFRVSIPVIFR